MEQRASVSNAAPWRAVWRGRAAWAARWGKKGGLAVLDQALFAGANFLVSISLARWLSPTGYGAFAVAYSLFWLLGTAYSALWTEPLLVYGSGRFRDNFAAYQGVLRRYHVLFSGGLFLLILAPAAGLLLGGNQSLGLSFLGLAAAAPAVLYLWLVRQGTYVLLEPGPAAAAGGLYLLCYLGLAVLLHRNGLLNAATAFLAMGLAAVLAAWAVRPRGAPRKEGAVDPREVRRLHWRYGQWALLAGVLSWVPANFCYLALPAFHTLEAAARLKALMNLLMPALHFNRALAQLLVPGMVRAREGGGLVRFTRGSLGALVLFSLIYWLVLSAFGGEVMGWLYGGRYTEDQRFLPLLGAFPVLAAAGAVMTALLRAQERPARLAAAYGVLTGAALSVGLGLVWRFGLAGAVAALLALNGLAVVLFSLLSRVR